MTMFGLNSLELFGFIVVIVAISVVLVDKFYLSKKRKAMGNYIRVLLFEQVGQDKVYIGETMGVESFDSKLGIVIKLKKFNTAISGVNSDLYFFDKKVGKTLLVCRFSEEDYRPMHRLASKNTYIREIVDVPMLDKNGKQLFEDIEIKDVDGKVVDVEKIPLYSKEEQFVQLLEPVGISQTAREALRFKADFSKRMQEKRGEKQGWWDKYGTFAMMGAFLMIILISTAYNSNKFEEASRNIASVFDENMKKAIESVNSPSFVNNLLNDLAKTKAESETPAS